MMKAYEEKNSLINSLIKSNIDVVNIKKELEQAGAKLGLAQLKLDWNFVLLH